MNNPFQRTGKAWSPFGVKSRGFDSKNNIIFYPEFDYGRTEMYKVMERFLVTSFYFMNETFKIN